MGSGTGRLSRTDTARSMIAGVCVILFVALAFDEAPTAIAAQAGDGLPGVFTP